MKSFAENLFRGPHVDAGFLDIQGFEATLDLESGAQVFGDDFPLVEASECEQHNIRCYPHPLGAVLPPTIHELNLATIFLANQKKRGVRTYVHCKHGVDRTGLVVAAYRVIWQDWTPKAAAEECLAEGMHKIYLPWLVQLWRLK